MYFCVFGREPRAPVLVVLEVVVVWAPVWGSTPSEPQSVAGPLTARGATTCVVALVRDSPPSNEECRCRYYQPLFKTDLRVDETL